MSEDFRCNIKFVGTDGVVYRCNFMNYASTAHEHRYITEDGIIYEGMQLKMEVFL